MPNLLQQTLFILNFSSGSKKAKPFVEELMKRELNYYISESAEAFQNFIQQNKANYNTLVICGGDGTIHSIINQTHELGMRYAIYPTGSGNGLARELGYKRDIDKLVQTLERNETSKIDLIKINDAYCINMSGIGFDGYVAHKFDKSRKRGFVSYIKETLRALRKYKPIEASLEIDEQEVRGDFFMINIANTRQFGNNAYIAPKAQYNDGLIELALIQKVPFYNLPIFLYQLFNLGLHKSKYAQYFQARKITIDAKAEFYHMDGEPLSYEKKLEITIPKQLEFIKTV